MFKLRIKARALLNAITPSKPKKSKWSNKKGEAPKDWRDFAEVWSLKPLLHWAKFPRINDYMYPEGYLQALHKCSQPAAASVANLFNKFLNDTDLYPFPEKPAPCPFCHVETVRGWVEKTPSGHEHFFIEHGDPVCELYDKVVAVSPRSEREVKGFRHWSKS